MSTAGFALLIFGLFPMYVSIFAVEKYYTNFWTGFWNIYGLAAVLFGVAIDATDPSSVFLAGALGSLIVLLLYLVMFSNEYSQFVRQFGASLLTSSLAIGLYLGFEYGASAGLLGFALNLLFIAVLGKVAEDSCW